ncbi:MAG: MurR/RpiR family transcriptional regulator [Lachnospiraceae bacterium]|uniref:MurR/RpiR family transcriptional regulator n=1 Tax=Candidatus Weimeria bifida TaxID=2599074 RepID=A0A6N7IZ55_9FIRM|nr:MurR/RpiR family transcriptional regulator [Candidatus Weimeria bifida]RRF96026.1 MAG: MurR/RpiR family transcriptional regulator [Lachnospiraceae bacterium]
MRDDVFTRINDRYSSMSKGQQQLSAYITDCIDKAAFMNAYELGSRVGVSESTVVRFATFLGYKGYKEFSQAMASEVKNHLVPSGPKEAPYISAEIKDTLTDTLKQDIENLESTKDSIDHDAYLRAVEMLLNAKRVFIAGVSFSAPLADYFAMYLRQALPDVRVLSKGSMQHFFSEVIDLNENDVMVGISFPGYSLSVLRLLEYSQTKNTPVITITDSVHSPLNMYSTVNLTASCDRNAFASSPVAGMSVIGALVMGVLSKRSDKVRERNRKMEDLLNEFDFSGVDRMDPLKDSVL